MYPPCTVACGRISLALDAMVATDQVISDQDIYGAAITMVLGASGYAAGRVTEITGRTTSNIIKSGTMFIRGGYSA